MELLKTILKRNETRAALWQIANGILIIGVAVFTEMNPIYVPFLMALLNFTTKKVNKFYL